MIKEGKVVNLAYTLKNDEGETLDSADKNDPFTYMHGGGEIVPGLESALEGLKKGDTKAVDVPPSEGYGEVDSNLRIEVKRSQFPPGIEIKEGMQFETTTPDNHSLVFTIASVGLEKVTIDGNHPLAGKTLHFNVEVLDVRDATAEETDHGHAHGPEGHEGHHH